jgi:hypothetical protein
MNQPYKKTAKGVSELARHELQLRPELRRLLILIDGTRSVEALAPLFRANELPALIDELVAVGAIEIADTAVSYVPTSATAKAGTDLNAVEFDAARRTAEIAAKSALGRSADPLVDAIRQSRDWQMFRVAVSAVQLKLISQHGEEAATRYVVAIRDAIRAVSKSSK